jgi:hypothetical protein
LQVRSGKIGASWSLSVVATNLLGCRPCSRIRRRTFLELTAAAMAQLCPNPAIAIGLELIADSDHGCDDRCVVSR